MLLVLGMAVLLNYIDRGNLATAAPLLQDELSLSSVQIGWLLSAFFWVYAPAQIVAGWLVHRYDIRIVLGVGVALWSAATALTGLAGGFASILGLRLLLGIGESVTFPAWQLILARHTVEHERGRANGFVSAGQGAGTDARDAPRRTRDGALRMAGDVRRPRPRHVVLAAAVVRRDA